tara:strand:+ start:127124 stop:127966 length:843 start_codon:yes stop_codon:yes gene_type:complete
MKIVLPTDFSDNAWNAIFTTIKLYANVPCYFYIVHAYEPNELNLLGKNSQQRLGVIYDSLSQYSEQELDKIIAYLNKNHPNANHNFEAISKADTLDEALRAIIRTKDIDLIAMGTQGATGAKSIFIGSSTVKVLKHVKGCPVLVVPTEYNFQRLKTLVFPTNFNRPYEKFELLPMTNLVSLWKAEIQILHISVEFVLSDTQKENKKILEERLTPLKYSYQNTPFEKSLSTAIEKFASNNNIDLMAMIRNHHTFWEKIIGEPVVKKTAFHSQIPVLMLPEK